MAALAPPYLPRRPTETPLYSIVRENLESFLAFTRENYEKPLPRYVEAELRGYLKCGIFAEGFTRARCDSCGHDLLIAFSCKSRTVCPSCTGRRMANSAAAVVDRVLPDVAVRQYVLTFPYELRKLVAFKADALTAMGRIAVEAIFASYKGRAKHAGVARGECGAINFVQRFGSLNLHVHFHIVVPDGVFVRGEDRIVRFHSAPAPTRAELDAIVDRIEKRAVAWLRRRGHLEERPLEERSNETAVQTALDACAAIAMGRGHVATLPKAEDADDPDHASAPDKPAVAVDRRGFNLHAGVRIEAGDDLSRERLVRYGARPPLSLERLRRLPGGRVAYRLKYVARGRGKYRVMGGVEFLARLAAIIAPPRYPLVRFAGVFGPRSAWRKDVVPRPRDAAASCPKSAPREVEAATAGKRPDAPCEERLSAPSPRRESLSAVADRPPNATPACDMIGAANPTLAIQRNVARDASSPSPGYVSPVRPDVRPGDVIELTPNVIAVRHWERLLGGLLYAATPRVAWTNLLRRSFDVDALECGHLGLPAEVKPTARARDPTDEYGDEPAEQLAFA